MTSYSYLTDDDVPPEYTQPAAQIRRIFSRLIEMEKKTQRLELDLRVAVQRIKAIEGRERI